MDKDTYFLDFFMDFKIITIFLILLKNLLRCVKFYQKQFINSIFNLLYFKEEKKYEVKNI